MKADSFEGGDRMPCIVRWPGHIPSGQTTDEVICFTDMLATFVAIAGDTLPSSAGEGSYFSLSERGIQW
jgi:arylsulfatase A-like enzyme